MTKQSFLKGALILIIAGLITRFLGFINRIVMARLIGEEGIGLYNMALPTLFLLYTISQVGLPIAISKRVAEATVLGDQKKIKQILVLSLLLTTSISIVVTIGIFFFAPFIAKNLLTDERVYYPLIAIIPIIPISAIAAVIRGYFQGKQNMKPQSYAQVLEQTVRILSVAFFVNLFLPLGIEFAAAGAMFSVILGEFISLLFMVFMFKTKKTIKLRSKLKSYLFSGKETFMQLMKISIPSTFSRLIGSISNFLEPIIVSQSLLLAGIPVQLATKQYGSLTGYAFPLLFLPTFFTHALAIALVPNISEADARKNTSVIHYRIHQAIRLSFASGAIATVSLMLFGETILHYMYGNTNATIFLKIMAPGFLFMYIQFPLYATLQALDLAKEAMWNSIIATIIKFIILFILTANPAFGITGVAISLVIGVVVGTALHLISLWRTIKFTISWGMLFKMILLFILTYWAGSLFKIYLTNYSESLAVFLFLLVLLAIIYCIFLFGLGFISKKELSLLREKKH
ncbi:stage V sporulation protein B [Saliterribacillus persicus]|uniref:Stage V sporulation protein B n=1 Tax=Saliterribacillus persicus TaxID=930114 RepID=A0A368XGX1_9BACI|nr:stage V sporulation protein B [Saliterribacillus persicus]RCW66436.1 stage V sporulation protein B [Saliterribacillus persicus]